MAAMVARRADASRCQDRVGRAPARRGAVSARMTLGPPPALPWDEIFGVTTYELG